MRPYQTGCTSQHQPVRYNPDIHHRRSIRLKGFDYSQAGAYFVTVCTQNRQYLFGEISENKIRLNDAGRMIRTIWEGLSNRFPSIALDQFVVMPNHVHGIIMLIDSIHRRGESCIRPNPHNRPNQGDHKDRPYGTWAGTIGRIMQTFKSTTTHEYIIGVRQYGWFSFPGKLWQRNYYEHIIHNEAELNRTRQYICDNPLNWETDEENPDRKSVSRQTALS